MINLCTILLSLTFDSCTYRFQWKGDHDEETIDSWNEKEVEHIGQELADCAIYLIRLSDVCSVDLAESVLRLYHKV